MTWRKPGTKDNGGDEEWTGDDERCKKEGNQRKFDVDGLEDGHRATTLQGSALLRLQVMRTGFGTR